MSNRLNLQSVCWTLLSTPGATTTLQIHWHLTNTVNRNHTVIMFKCGIILIGIWELISKEIKQEFLQRNWVYLFFVCEIQSRNKRKHLPVCLCSDLVDDVSLNIITLYTLFVSNAIETHDTLLGFVKALTMRIRLHSYSETTGFDYSDTKCYCQ